MNYYLTQWEWRDGAFCAPVGAIGALDLGTIVEASEIASLRPKCLCWSRGLIQGLGIPLFVGNVNDAVGKRVIDAFRAVDVVVAGTTFGDVLLSSFTEYADPYGVDAPSTIVPTRGVASLNMHGHDVELRRRVRAGVGTYGTKIIVNARLASAAIREAVEHGKMTIHAARRVVGAMAMQYGVTWQILCDAATIELIKFSVTPETAIADTFDRANASTLGTSSGGWSWGSMQYNWSIASNRASPNLSGSYVRAEYDLSSTNHWSQAVVSNSSTSQQVGTGVRMASGTTITLYAGLQRNNSSVTFRLRKLISGTATNLVDINTTAVTSGTLRTTADGSSISVSWNGVTVAGPTTDTSISGSVRCGLVGSPGSSNYVDDFAAEDIIVASGGARLDRVVGRGVLRGVMRGA